MKKEKNVYTKPNIATHQITPGVILQGSGEENVTIPIEKENGQIPEGVGPN